jgi:Ala-tRNA(Pro) deacylase
MSGKERLETYLREHNVAFQEDHHPIAYTAQEVAAAEHVPGHLVAKSVLVVADGRMVMLALPAIYQVDLRRVAEMLGAPDARLAREDEFANVFPDCELGAIPPFGNLYQLPVYVDRSLAEDETIIFPAGTHTDTISVPYADFDRLVNPSLADFRSPAGR